MMRVVRVSGVAKQSNSNIVLKPGIWIRARLRTMIDMGERICLDGFMEYFGMLTHSGSECMVTLTYSSVIQQPSSNHLHEEIANIAKDLGVPVHMQRLEAKSQSAYCQN